MEQVFNILRQTKQDDLSNLFHNFDWPAFLTRLAVGMILAIVGFLARFLWKKLKDLNLPELWKDKASKAVAETEQAAIKATEILKAMEADYARRLKELEEKHSQTIAILESKYNDAIKQIEAKKELAELALTRANDTIKVYEELMDNIQQERDETKKRIIWLETEIQNAKPKVAELEEENRILRNRVSELEAINRVEAVRRRGTNELKSLSDDTGGKSLNG